MPRQGLSFPKGETMNIDYTICPHCGCSCEDDEFCAACGKLFHDDLIPARSVSLFSLLKAGFKSTIRKKKSDDHSYRQNDDVVIDPEYSSLSYNVFSDDRWSD